MTGADAADAEAPGLTREENASDWPCVIRRFGAIRGQCEKPGHKERQRAARARFIGRPLLGECNASVNNRGGDPGNNLFFPIGP